MNLELLEQYNSYIVLALMGLLLISLLLHITTWLRLQKIKNNYQQLTKGIDNRNLEQIILSVSEHVDQSSIKLQEIDSRQKELGERLKVCIKTPDIIRYNAFDNMGSNLSFSVSLLDQMNNGVVLTSIYGRDESRLYAKIINDGKSEQLLSPEEEQVLAKK